MAGFKRQHSKEGDPLDKLMIERNGANGKLTSVKALHAGWVKNVKWTQYEVPPSSGLPVEKEEWMAAANAWLKDVKWLLSLPYNRFWSHVAHDPGLHEFLQSYISQAKPPNNQDEDFSRLERELYKFVLLVFTRMSIHRESKTNHLTPHVFGEIVYSAYAFDIPKTLDLCYLYEGTHRKYLQKIIGNVFDHSPQYQEDLRASVKPLMEGTFDAMEEQLGLSSGSVTNKLKKGSGDDSSHLKDLVQFAFDTATSVNTFLEIYSPAVMIFYQDKYHQRLAEFYQTAVPVLCMKVKQLGDEQTRLTLNLTRKTLLKIFRNIVTTIFLQPVLNDLTNEGKQTTSHGEKYIEEVTMCLSYKCFLRDYDSVFPILDDLNLFTEIKLNPQDLVTLAHLKQGLGDLNNEALEEFMSNSGIVRRSKDGFEGALQKQQVEVNKRLKDTGDDEDEYEKEEVDDNVMVAAACLYSEMEAAACPLPQQYELESQISYVADMFPDLGLGFIEACLEYYAFIPENVINAICEETLPDKLKMMDRNAPKAPKTVSEIDKRVSTFDNDQFDILRRNDVDTSRIHMGKSKHKNMAKKYNKKALESCRDRFEKYGSCSTEGSMYDRVNQFLPEYDDEYDDTYDGDAVAEPDVLCGREYTLPRVLAGPTRKIHKYKTQKNSDTDDDEEEDAAPKTNFRAFVSDPAERREKLEQRREQQQSRHKNRDVVGKTRGQGQEKETLQNRKFKEAHKSSRANHNRKQGAQWKRGRAMF